MKTLGFQTFRSGAPRQADGENAGAILIIHVGAYEDIKFIF
jgi:hypothetical protein